MLYGIFVPLRSTKFRCVGVPSPKQRHDILLAHLSEMEHSLSEVQVQHLATATHGFVGADLAALCNEAALIRLRTHIEFIKSCDDSDASRTSIVGDGFHNATTESSYCSKDTLDSASPSITHFVGLAKIQNAVEGLENGVCGAAEQILKVTFEDFEKAKMKVRPSAMREVCLTHPYCLGICLYIRESSFYYMELLLSILASKGMQIFLDSISDIFWCSTLLVKIGCSLP